MGKMKELWIRAQREQEDQQRRDQQAFYRVLDRLTPAERQAFRAGVSSTEVR